MKTSGYFLICFIWIVCINCNSARDKNGSSKLIENEIPKFLNCLSTMSHDSMRLAFHQINATLKYEIKNNPTSQGTLEADKRVGKTGLDGEAILLASPLLPHSSPNEFGISIIIYPPPNLIDSNMLLEITKKMLGNYQRIDSNGKTIWKINGWFLEVKKPNIVTYYAYSTKSLYDLFDKSY